MTTTTPDPSGSPAARQPARRVLFGREHRGTTCGLLLIVTLMAFENLGVGTAMPTMVADLDGGELYSWPFTAFLVASVVATVLSGRLCDRRGPVPSLLAGPAVFLAGLVVAGCAPGMSVLLVGRVLQGLGTGTVLVATSLLVALVFTDRERPVIYAANAAAWVLPAVLGPPIAGFVTGTAGWRWVFFGLVPLVPLGVLLLVPVLRRFGRYRPATSTTEPAASATSAREPATSTTEPAGEPARIAGVPSAVLAAAGVAALTWAAQHPSATALAYGGAGLLAVTVALRRLLPAGTFGAGTGLPAVVRSRALLAATFAGMQAYLPLTMTAVHGYSPALAGMPLTVTAISWSLGSALQGRYPDWDRGRLVRTAFVLVAVGIGLFGCAAVPGFPGWVAFVASAVGGAGMGLGVPSLQVLMLRHVRESERGFASSAMQLGDWVASALVIGFGGVLLGSIATAADPAAAIVVLGASLAAVAAAGGLAAGGVRGRTGQDAGGAREASAPGGYTG